MYVADKSPYIGDTKSYIGDAKSYGHNVGVTISPTWEIKKSNARRPRDNKSYVGDTESYLGVT